MLQKAEEYIPQTESCEDLTDKHSQASLHQAQIPNQCLKRSQTNC